MAVRWLPLDKSEFYASPDNWLYAECQLQLAVPVEIQRQQDDGAPGAVARRDNTQV